LSHGDVIKPPAQFFNRPIDKLIAELGTTPAGLSTPEAGCRLQIFGLNQTIVVKQPKAWSQLLRRFANPLVIVLLIASALSAATGDVGSFFIVVTIVFVSMLMDFVQERRAQNAINALREKVALRVRVMRDEKEAVLSADEIVPGDIVNLAAGDLVPADGRLITAQDFFLMTRS
jgi:P-type Mg2+ transporter